MHVLPPIRLSTILLLILALDSGLFAQQTPLPNTAFINGQWFNGTTFEPRTVYAVHGVFSFAKPQKVDTTIDLSGQFVVPPLAEAHNHNIGTGNEELDRKAIQKFLASGVFYVKIQGNLPISAATKQKLGINNGNGIDVSFSQGTLTATGGQPIFIIERLHPSLGFNKGYTREQLKDYRYFTIDSEQELEEKWNKVIPLHPDFIKAFVWRSNEYELLKDDTTVFFKGLNPALLPKIVAKAKADRLRVSVHVTNAADFHQAVLAGADEITHLPRFVSGQPNPLIEETDARIAAQKGIVVISTVAASLFQGGLVKEADRPLARQFQTENLKILVKYGVPIAIGSDDISDNTWKEVSYLKSLGVFDNLAILKMWTETAAKTIFPGRKIGLLSEGYEASFLAVQGNPLEDLENIRKITLMVKQGYLQ